MNYIIVGTGPVGVVVEYLDQNKQVVIIDNSSV